MILTDDISQFKIAIYLQQLERQKCNKEEGCDERYNLQNTYKIKKILSQTSSLQLLIEKKTNLPPGLTILKVSRQNSPPVVKIIIIYCCQSDLFQRNTKLNFNRKRSPNVTVIASKTSQHDFQHVRTKRDVRFKMSQLKLSTSFCHIRLNAQFKTFLYLRIKE